ncbi:DUF930 domain-containing protein [Pararhizobium sp.]|uniref:DUF930 domain-containing protein n=1 Tax=Pararhizobium sp. TaxID=1977563 RepID=UPI002715CE53|nr:DUF930 domain-containing protein [Pararhizobium sp.]MDO9417286.1 DUF930 domain-containing protein [Pararhizobium sp.]
MKRISAAVILSVIAASPAAAIDARIKAQLNKLDPQTRLEQRCDTEALDRISRDEHGFKPDKVIAYTFAEPEIDGTSIRAPGAVFRSKGDWYTLSFTCTTGPKRLHVRAFDYDIGTLVPRQAWEEHFLYD